MAHGAVGALLQMDTVEMLRDLGWMVKEGGGGGGGGGLACDGLTDTQGILLVASNHRNWISRTTFTCVQTLPLSRYMRSTNESTT